VLPRKAALVPKGAHLSRGTPLLSLGLAGRQLAARHWRPVPAHWITQARTKNGGDPGWNRRRLLRYVVASKRGAEECRSRSPCSCGRR
jgi:hypothetical protein